MLKYDSEITTKLKKLTHWSSLLLFVYISILASSPGFSNSVNVKGYTRKDGTYVQPSQRTAPNSTRNDNFSTRGNINPYTGKAGTKQPGENLAIGSNSGGQYPTVDSGEINITKQQQESSGSNCELKLSQMNQIQRGEVVRILGNNCSMVFNAVR